MIAWLLNSWLLCAVIVVLLAVVAYLYLKGFARTRNKKDIYAQRLIDSMETERKRIASELHDSIGQELMIIKNRAMLALNNLKNRKVVEEQLHEISNAASQALQETREITYQLRPYQLDKLGLTKAIESIIDRAEKATTIEFKCDIDPIDNVIPKDMEIHLYRIVQECVSNIVKHSKATLAKVRIKRWHNRVNIDVEDNGTGFDISAERNGGLGILGIMERVKYIGGTMKIESNIGVGTRVLMTIRTGD